MTDEWESPKHYAEQVDATLRTVTVAFTQAEDAKSCDVYIQRIKKNGSEDKTISVSEWAFLARAAIVLGIVDSTGKPLYPNPGPEPRRT